MSHFVRFSRKVGDKFGESFPDVKNVHNMAWSKLGNNNATGRIRYVWRRFKAAVEEHAQRFVHGLQDSRTQVVRLNKREVQLLRMARGGMVDPDKLARAFKRGDATRADTMAQRWVKGAQRTLEVMSKIQEQAKARHDEYTKGLTEAKERLAWQTIADNLKAAASDRLYVNHHPHWAGDWQRRLVVIGDHGKGVAGAANHFVDEYRMLEKSQGAVEHSQRDQILRHALQKNLANLETYEKQLQGEVDRYLALAQQGRPIQPQRLLALKHSAVFDAMEFTEKCLADTKEGAALRAELLSNYSMEFGLDNSLNRAFSVSQRRSEYRAKLDKLVNNLHRNENRRRQGLEPENLNETRRQQGLEPYNLNETRRQQGLEPDNLEG